MSGVATILVGDLKDGMRRAFDGAEITSVRQEVAIAAPEGMPWATVLRRLHEDERPMIDGPQVLSQFSCRDRTFVLPAWLPVKVEALDHDF